MNHHARAVSQSEGLQVSSPCLEKLRHDSSLPSSPHTATDGRFCVCVREPEAMKNKMTIRVGAHNPTASRAYSVLREVKMTMQ